MSEHIGADVPKERLSSAQYKNRKAEEHQSPKEISPNVFTSDPSMATGLSWAYQMNAPQNMSEANGANLNLTAKSGMDPYIALPGDEDMAVLSSMISTDESSSISAPSGKGFETASLLGLNPSALEETYRKYFKASRSHNLLLERFMAHFKFSAIKMVCSLIGVSMEEQIRIQKEVRVEALAEIDTKFRHDWAYSKALLEIVG